MEEASLVAIGVHALCELAWVLSRQYAISRTDVAETIRRLIEAENVVVDRLVVDAGLRVLDAGGDVADGVIASRAAVSEAKPLSPSIGRRRSFLTRKASRPRFWTRLQISAV